MTVNFEGTHFPPAAFLMGIRWYVAYPLSTRHVKELLEEHGVNVDHSTINQRVIKYSPQFEASFHHRKRLVGSSWRLDETYVRLKGKWVYLYRELDKSGQTIDFLLTARRDQKTEKRFLTKAIGRNIMLEKITIDKSAANAVAIVSYNMEHRTSIHIRQCKYLNNIVEQDPRGVKRITRPMLGFHSFHAVHHTIVGIKLMRMIKKEQLAGPEGSDLSAAEQFYALAA